MAHPRVAHISPVDPDVTNRPIRFKVTGDSLLIHESAYSLFIGLCSVTSNMTGYSHSHHSIKLIHWGAPQRDVLSDKMVL